MDYNSKIVIPGGWLTDIDDIRRMADFSEDDENIFNCVYRMISYAAEGDERYRTLIDLIKQIEFVPDHRNATLKTNSIIRKEIDSRNEFNTILAPQKGSERLFPVAYKHKTVFIDALTPNHCTDLAVARFYRHYIVGGNAYPIDEVKTIIRSMDYKDFLNTCYWKAVAKYVRRKANYTCEHCGEHRQGNELHVHHITYKNHGDELHHIEDLMCVCKSCHEEIHQKQEEDNGRMG